MKRITFVFISIVAITATVLLSQKDIEDAQVNIVKLDQEKHTINGIYD